MESPSPAPKTPDQLPTQPTDPITPSPTHSNISSPGIIRNEFPRNPFAARTATHSNICSLGVVGDQFPRNPFATPLNDTPETSNARNSSTGTATDSLPSSPTHADLALKCEVLRLSNTYNEREVHRLKTDRQTLESNTSRIVAEIQGLISCNEELRVLRREHEATVQEISDLQSRMKDLKGRRKELKRVIRHLGLRTRKAPGTKGQRLNSLTTQIASHCKTLRTQTKLLRSQKQALLHDRKIYLSQISSLQKNLRDQNIFIHGLQLFVERVVREKTDLEMVLADRVKDLSAGQKALVRKQLDKEDRERAQKRIREVPEVSSPPKGQPRGRRRSWHGELQSTLDGAVDPVPADELESPKTTIASLQAEVESERMEKERIQSEEMMAMTTCLFFIFLCIFVVVWNSRIHAPTDSLRSE